MTAALMTAEMAEQPRTLGALAAHRLALIEEVRTAMDRRRPAGIVLIARGSSDNAATYGRYVLELATGLPVALATPSLVTRYGASNRLDGWLAVGVSQSGATPEIVTVLERYAAAGAMTIAITNDRSSPLATATAGTINTAAGAERAVPATKTVTAQFAAFAILAEALAATATTLPWSAADWMALPAAVSALLADDAPAEALAARLDDCASLLVVARGLLLGAAQEAALKMKELTGILAEGASTADALHGPIAIAGPKLPVLTIDAGGPTSDDIARFAAEARHRGADVLSIGPDGELPLPRDVPEGLAAILAIVRSQQLARHASLRRGVDPDAPFGLSKITATR